LARRPRTDRRRAAHTGVRRLVQSVGIHDPRDRYTSSFDGMAELWFDDVEAVLRARARAQSGKPPPQTKSISSITAERRTF
jgi:hypothetical protein